MLAIVERAYRGAIEEQYAHILWLTHALRKMQGEVSLLLRGNAVLYARRGQLRPGLAIGGLEVDHLPDYGSALEALLADGVAVYALADDLRRLGVEARGLVPGVEQVELSGMARLCDRHGRIWYW